MWSSFSWYNLRGVAFVHATTPEWMIKNWTTGIVSACALGHATGWRKELSLYSDNPVVMVSLWRCWLREPKTSFIVVMQNWRLAMQCLIAGPSCDCSRVSWRWGRRWWLVGSAVFFGVARPVYSTHCSTTVTFWQNTSFEWNTFWISITSWACWRQRNWNL